MTTAVLSTSFFSQLTKKRMFAAHIAEIAVAMAQQAGETPARPLSKAQLERALEANYVESNLVMDLILTWAGELNKSGEISDNDYFGPS